MSIFHGVQLGELVEFDVIVVGEYVGHFDGIHGSNTFKELCVRSESLASNKSHLDVDSYVDDVSLQNTQIFEGDKTIEKLDILNIIAAEDLF